MAVLTFASVLAVFLFLAWEHGGAYIEAASQKMLAEAQAANAVASAVTKLTSIQERMERDVTSAHRVQSEALMEILEEFRKNCKAAPTGVASEAASKN